MSKKTFMFCKGRCDIRQNRRARWRAPNDTGSLLEIEILYNEKESLSIPDTSIMHEGSKKFIYKIIENGITKKIEVETGIRNKGNLEVLNGLNQGDKIVAEGLTKVRPNMKIKPIIKSQ